MTERQGRYRVKRDANQGEIEDALTQAGYVWFDTSKVGRGFPDLTVMTKRGAIVLLEVKAPGGTLTMDEKVFHFLWQGAPVLTVYSAEEALRVLTA